MKYDVFISCTGKDIEEVTGLSEMLRQQFPSLSYWFDTKAVENADEYESKVLPALAASSVVLFAMSEASLNSLRAKDVVISALNADIKVVPVLLEDAELKGWARHVFDKADCIDITDERQKELLILNLASWMKTVPAKRPDPDASCPCGSSRSVKDCHGKDLIESEAYRRAENIWRVGDHYDVNGKMGIVFWVDETGKHGKIVSPDEAELPWCTYEEYHEHIVTGAYDRNDGMNNQMTIMKIDGWREKYPAFAWCESHGPGWYLPAINELDQLMYNDAAKVILKSSPSLRSYWSSTEDEGPQGIFELMRLKYGIFGFKDAVVRAVAAF